MVSKLRTHKRFSFTVRMKRSATPLPSGARTKLGELSIPKNATSCWKSSARSFEPWSWRRRSPSATPSPMGPKRSRTPWRIGSRASNRVPRLAAWRPMHSAVQ